MKRAGDRDYIFEFRIDDWRGNVHDAIPAQGKKINLSYKGLELIVELRRHIKDIPVGAAPAFELEEKLLRAIGSLHLLDLHVLNEGVLVQEGLAQRIKGRRIQRAQHAQFAFGLGSGQNLGARRVDRGPEHGRTHQEMRENKQKRNYRCRNEVHRITSFTLDVYSLARHRHPGEISAGYVSLRVAPQSDPSRVPMTSTLPLSSISTFANKR